ncbi:ATP-binding protein [Paenibacillus lentus]|uniref:ATP-binding protein n=1 Tax=Paenibacillus lentus TaxID=1338368 RepID=UPI0036D3EB7D
MVNAWTARECQCEKDRLEKLNVQKLFAELHVPKRYQGKTIQNFDQSLLKGRGYDMAVRYVERFDEIRHENTNGLAFIGPPGTGKTHLAYAILNALVPRVRSAICGSVPDLMEMLRPKSDRELGEQRLHALKTSELVVLDDLGAEQESSWVTERLFMILNARYNEQLPTIITSNVELGVLERIPGWGRVGSRITEMCHAVLCDGADHRKLKKTKNREG